MKPSVRASSVDGLRRELKDLRRSAMDLHRIIGDVGGTEPIGATEIESSSGGGVPTLFVAASDAIDRSKEYADYVCDGTDDDVEINAALTAASGTGWGGAVVLSEGQFNLSGQVTASWGSVLRGQGNGTYLETTYSVGVDLTAGSAYLRDLVLYGPSSSGSIGVKHGDYSRVIDCGLGNFATVIYGSALTRAVVRGSEIAGTATYGIDLDGLGTLVDISGNYLSRPVRVNTNLTLFHDNRCASGCTISVTGGANNCFDGNYLHGGLGSFTDSGTGTQRGTNFSSGGTW